MRDEYRDLWEGRLYADGKLVVTGRIQWLPKGPKYMGLRLHTEQLTAEQVQRILEGPLMLAFFGYRGKAYGIGDDEMAADQLLEGAEEVVLMATDQEGWQFNF